MTPTHCAPLLFGGTRGGAALCYLPGRLSARGAAHEADATSSHLGTMHLDRTLAALAFLTVYSLDG